MSCTSSYLTNALHSDILRKNVAGIIKRLKLSGIVFDGIAFTGMSGALVAPLVAFKMGKKLLMVRKEKDASHSSYLIEGHTDIARYIVLDDLVCTGESVQRVVKEILSMKHDRRLGGLKCVGVFCWYERYMGEDGSSAVKTFDVPTNFSGDTESVDWLRCVAVEPIKEAEMKGLKSLAKTNNPDPAIDVVFEPIVPNLDIKL